MKKKKNILVIIGSASTSSSNERLVDNLVKLSDATFNITIFNTLKNLPHFDPDLSMNTPPGSILEFREKIQNADGVIICTPEYVFSIPSGLKNAIEWCVSTTVFSDKPTGLITASAHGQKGHEELLLIMKTIGANFTDGTTLLIQGVKGKIDEQGQITNEQLENDLKKIMEEFKILIGE